jgi:glutathione S-transferase
VVSLTEIQVVQIIPNQPEKTMKLYEFAPTRSIRVRWTLQELAGDFEAIPVNMLAGENRSPTFLKINPAGKLPVLVDGDMVLTESIAIVLYLAEKRLVARSERSEIRQPPDVVSLQRR